MKVVTILGARPQFIKASVVSKEINQREEIEEVIIHTGQHFDKKMSDVFFQEMSIPKPDFNLGINQLSHGAMTGRMIEEIEKILIEEKPEWVLVYGDTNSTLAGALAAKKLHIKVAHVEAGLRSYNMGMPEEINRILTDRISDLLLCPTEKAVENLELEGFENFDCEVVNVGDVMLDATLTFSKLATERSGILNDLEIDQPFALCTVHREENTNDQSKLQNIFAALEHISKEIPVVCPLHPRTQGLLGQIRFGGKIMIIEPVGYLDMQMLLSACNFVLTDSGGLQKEAYFHEKKCFTLREETEWTELVEVGANVTVGTNRDYIISAALGLMSDEENEWSSSELYGDGAAAARIIDKLLSCFS